MKRTIFFSLLLICTYSINILADQIADELTKFAKSLQDLESVISGQPTSGTNITDEIDENFVILGQSKANIKIDLAELAGYKDQNVKPQIPYDANILDGLRNELRNINQVFEFFMTNKARIPEADKKQLGRDIFNIKNDLVQILTHLSGGVTTAAQATILLQYIDEFYTKGIADTQHRNFLGSKNYTVSDQQIASITTTMNAIIQKTPAQQGGTSQPAPTKPLTPLKPIPTPQPQPQPSKPVSTEKPTPKPKPTISKVPETTQPLTPLSPAPEPTQPLVPLEIPMERQIQTYLGELGNVLYTLTYSIIPQSQIPLPNKILDTWKLQLKDLGEAINFLQTNSPNNPEIQTKLIMIKDKVIEFLVYLKSLATTKNQAATLLQYIDEFYTNGVAQTNYQSLLGDMKPSNATIEQLKNDLDAIINPVTPLVPAPKPAPAQPLIPLQTQRSPEQQREIADLITNLNGAYSKFLIWVDEGDTDKVSDFMGGKKYSQSFQNYYSPKINQYAPTFTSNERKTIQDLLKSISSQLKSSDNIKTLQNKDKFISDIGALNGRLLETEID